MWARQHRGAINGQGIGLQGYSYAIPTKDEKLKSLGLEYIHYHVLMFLDFAEDNSEMIFQVTPIGCGLAGYKPKDIAWMFENHTENVHLPTEFKEVLSRTNGPMHD